MKHCALITGATSGIGEAIAYEFAKRKYNILIVGRREDRLKTVAHKIKEMGVEVEYKCIDLCDESSRAGLCAYIIENHTIDMLVNNAGVGAFGLFEVLERERQLQMIILNINALVDITHRLLAHMKNTGEKNTGTKNTGTKNTGTKNIGTKKHIVNIASVGGFQAGAYYAVYYATKAFVISFSEALSEECKKQGNNIFVSTVCPGPTKSEFFEQAGLMKKGDKVPKMLSHIPSAEALVKYAVPRILRKKVVIIHGVFFRIMIFIERFMPRALIRYMTTNIQCEKMKGE